MGLVAVLMDTAGTQGRCPESCCSVVGSWRILGVGNSSFLCAAGGSLWDVLPGGESSQVAVRHLLCERGAPPECWSAQSGTSESQRGGLQALHLSPCLFQPGSPSAYEHGTLGCLSSQQAGTPLSRSPFPTGPGSLQGLRGCQVLWTVVPTSPQEQIGLCFVARMSQSSHKPAQE